MKNITKILLIFFTYLLLLNIAQAQEVDVSVVATILGIPAEYAKMPEFLYFVTLPFICVFAVLFGILTELRLFRRAYKINFVISFALTFMLLRFGILLLVISTLYTISAAFAAIVFAVLFIVGTGLLAYGRTMEWRKEYYDIHRERARIRESLTDKMTSYRNEITEVNMKIQEKDREIQETLNKMEEERNRAALRREDIYTKTKLEQILNALNIKLTSLQNERDKLVMRRERLKEELSRTEASYSSLSSTI